MVATLLTGISFTNACPLVVPTRLTKANQVLHVHSSCTGNPITHIMVVSEDLLCVDECILFISQAKKKYNINLYSLIAVLRGRVWPPPNHSRNAPSGFWFSVAAAMSHCKTPSPKYVTSVYKCWYCNKAEVEESLGNNIIYMVILCIYVLCYILLAVKHNCDEKRLDLMRKDHEDEVNDHGDN